MKGESKNEKPARATSSDGRCSKGDSLSLALRLVRIFRHQTLPRSCVCQICDVRRPLPLKHVHHTCTRIPAFVPTRLSESLVSLGHRLRKLVG